MNTTFNLQPHRQHGHGRFWLGRLLNGLLMAFISLTALLVQERALGEVAIAEPDQNAAGVSIDLQLQELKSRVLELNRDLYILEEELLFPANTQLSLYVSMNVDEAYRMDAIKLFINEQPVASYLYTDSQLDALERGGVHRLYTGNVRLGEHQLKAIISGLDAQGRNYERAAELSFTKETQAKFIELRILHSAQTNRPEFSFTQWQ